jgi:hypothetical protein
MQKKGTAGRSGGMVTADEAARLEHILSGFPTSEAQDQALLQDVDLGQQERTFVQFRVLRKRALRQTASAIRAALSACGDDGAQEL